MKLAIKMGLKQGVFSFFILSWLVLWVVFMVRENKRGEYAELHYLYTHSDADKRRLVIGTAYDYLIYCKGILTERATYKIEGLDDLAWLRARYLLWPAKIDLNDPQYILVFAPAYAPKRGYVEIGRFQGAGFILRKE